MMHAKNYNLTE